MTTDPGFRKRNKLPRINYLGLLRLHAWGSNAVKRGAAGKWTARLRLNTSAHLSVSTPPTIHTEPVKALGSALSPMRSRPLPTLEHAQQRKRQQNAPHRHRSPHACPPVLRPTRRCTQSTRLH